MNCAVDVVSGSVFFVAERGKCRCVRGEVVCPKLPFNTFRAELPRGNSAGLHYATFSIVMQHAASVNVASGVVEGKRRSPKYFVGERRSPNDIRTLRVNGDTVAFPKQTCKEMQSLW